MTTDGNGKTAARPAPRSTAREGQAAAGTAVQRDIRLPAVVVVSQLAEAMDVEPVDVIKRLMRNGVMAAINQAIDVQTAAQVAAFFGFRVLAQDTTARGTRRQDTAAATIEGSANLTGRAPVVTMLGHVDHGKTTLLDTIRKSNVVAKEAGGITQHIGAYRVDYKSNPITFLDTPGHEAFTAMRARGAQATDIAILVVAADDGVMPQTVEALDHARAAKVPIVVAINKVDKPGSDTDRAKRQLSEQGLLPEDWGGDTIMVPVSALRGDGAEDLLESILAVAEIAELKADPTQLARGVVIEAKMDKSRGPVATVLVQDGTLQVAQTVVAGETWGRIKAMVSDAGERVKEAGPSSPVEILGLDALPQAGDPILVLPDERGAKALVEERRRAQAALRAASSGISLEDVAAGIRSGQVQELPLIVKCDVQGSIDALRSGLERLSMETAHIRILHAAAGTINESDVLLATASKAIIVGFNTRIEPGASQIADQRGVDVRLYNIIYRLTEEMEQALRGLFKEEAREVVEGHSQVRAVFGIPRRGRVAGCQVVDGLLRRGAQVRVLRNGEVVHTGPMSSLRRFKDDVREVTQGFECGVGLEGFSDFQEDDVLESFRLEGGD